MILTLISWLGLLVFIGLCFFVQDEFDDAYFVFVIFVLIFAMFAIVTLGAVIIGPASTRAEIQEFHALQETIQNARMDPDTSKFELAAIQQNVAEKNQWLASSKFWAKHPLTNWFYHKDILLLEPIN